MGPHGLAGAIGVAVGDRLHDVVVLGAVLEVQLGTEGALLQSTPDGLAPTVDQQLAHPDEHRVVGGQREAVMQGDVPALELLRRAGLFAADAGSVAFR